jgi:hypothetical protein
MAGRLSDRSGLPNATETWQPFDRFVKTLQAAAQAAVDANKPNTVLTRNIMPHDHAYLEDMKVRIKAAREKYEEAAVHLEAMEAALERHENKRKDRF